jgi:cytochrome b pre-mRNA-processing protein 3
MPIPSLFRRRTTADADLYMAAVEKARDPAFYAEIGVPDTVDGRFDMIVLHVTLLIRRLRRAEDPAAARTAQELFDYMFRDMDRSLRELGVGDMSVGKHIKKMAQAFYNRAATVESGLDQGGEALREALRDTVLRHHRETTDAPRLATYLERATAHLNGQAVEGIIAGQVDLKVAV